jgi:hypothetical protein
MPIPYPFSALSAEDQLRLRRIHHTTSAQVALQVLASRSIWGRDLDIPGGANFSFNPRPVDELPVAAEVSLEFHFAGPVQLISATAPPTTNAAGTLYVYVTHWPSRPGLKGMQIWSCRLPAGSAALEYRCAVAYADFVKRARTNARDGARLKKLMAVTACPIQVPIDKHERERARQVNWDASHIEVMEAWWSIRMNWFKRVLTA